MIREIKYLIAFLFLLLLGSPVQSQIKSIGIPDIVNYSRKDYHGSTQNWATVQDKRGILFFANNDGLLEFDGVNWRLLRMPNNSVVRSVAIDDQGTVFVGAFNEFGYLHAGKNGVLEYISLIDLIPEELRNFGDIWKIYPVDQGIIFQSFSEIFLYHNNKIKVIAQRRDFHFGFFVNNVFYITERNRGLVKLEDEKLIPVKGGELFKNDIWTMLPFNDKKILIGTANNGLFILENDSVRPWKLPINKFLKQNQIFCGVKVKEDYFVLGTILDGLIVFDEMGTPVQHVNRDKGLQNNTILSIYADNYDNLWLGLDNGIDYVNINSPFTNIVNESKIGAGYVSCLFQDKLYLGTNQGLFCKKWEEPVNPLEDTLEFKIVENTQGQVWNLFSYKNTLFCGHNNGTYIIQGNKARLLTDIKGGWDLFSLPDKEDVLLQGTYTGLLKYELQPDGTWKVNKIRGFNESSRVIEYYLGKDFYTLWISHGYKGVYRVNLDRELEQVVKVDFYDALSGLSTNYGNVVLKFKEDIIVANQTGVYDFDQEKEKFVPNPELNQLFGDHGALRKIVEDKNGRLWFIQGEEMGLAKQLSDGNYKINRMQFKAFAGNFIGSFEHLLPYQEESVIIATEDGFTHYNVDFKKDIDIPFYALIRSVEIGNDSLIFGGSFVDSTKHLTTSQSLVEIPDLSYKLNDLKFDFSATHFENLTTIEYQYYLKGYDESWSEWTQKTSKEYTNLNEGDYEFMVKARDVFNVESKPSAYKFVINPPWYRSLLAYILYLATLLIGSWLIFSMIRKRIDREKRLLHLKQKKELHQQKINHENEVLSAQQEIDKLRNEKLRMENEKNRAEVELKTKELASYAMQITQKNESLYGIKEQLRHISNKVNPDAQKYLQKLIKNIERNTNQKEDWEKFEGYFDQVYEDFTKRIREQYPHLTPNDIKLCAYLRMNLSTKEIAPLLNISIRGVEVSRYRLRKKLNLSKDDNLIDFMMNL
ncbi:MAG: two-component regulator propeller domain-containing protein [Bacteroidales bacterium]|nr:two-component regulator propeller domain-containing protein [Bacteroidales bacterium]